MNETIVYKDINFGFLKSIESISVNGDVNDEYMNLDFLKKSGFAPRRVATLESNRWKLDGACDLEGSSEDSTAGLYSHCMSTNRLSEYGYDLSSPISIVYQFKDEIQLQKMTFTFEFEEFCSYMYIELYNGDQIVNEEYFRPDSSFYNLSFDKEYSITSFKIEFISMNRPNRFLRLYNVDDGQSWSLNEDNIYEVNILGEMSVVSDALPYGTIDINYNTRNINFPIPQKLKPVYVFQKNQCERVGFVESVDTSNPKSNTVKLFDAPALIDSQKNVNISDYESQHLYEPTRDTEFEYYLATQDFVKGTTTYTANYNDYNPQIKEMTLIQILKKIFDNSPLNVKYKAREDIMSRKYFEAYVSNDTQKKIIIKLLFANQLSFKVNTNGVCAIIDGSNEYYNYDDTLLYADYKEKLNDVVNNIEIAVYSPTVEPVEILHDNKRFSISEEIGTMLAFKHAYFDPMYRITRYIQFDQNVPNELSVVLYASVSYEVDDMIVAYDKYYMKQDIQQYSIKKIDEYATVKKLVVEDNKFISTSNIDDIIVNLTQVYGNNKKLNFRSKLRGEREGDWGVVIIEGKKYTGKIEQIQYSLTNKKIGDITLQVYKEESNG